MNWEAIAAIAELIGALGVIVTLGYLARQIRRSNLLATAESNRFAYTAANPAILAIAQDSDTARVFREGLADRDSLSADDRIRFDMVMGAMIGGLSTVLVDQGILGHRHEFIASGQEENLRAFLRAPGGASWWAAYQARYAPAHREAMEKVLHVGDEPAA
jgi:hypothetical protein